MMSSFSAVVVSMTVVWMTCFDGIVVCVDFDELKLDVYPVFWMWSDVCENGSEVWRMRMEEVEGVVVTDVEVDQQCGQEVEMRLQLAAGLCAPSWSIPSLL